MQQILNSFRFGVNPIRVVLQDGLPWWFASDVCAVLSLGNPTKALLRLDEDEKSTLTSIQGGPDRNIISESGLYSLILGSRKKEAKAFKKWITSEVLPSIRNTGGYSAAPAIKVPQTLAEALRLAADAEDQRAALSCTVKVLAPKAEALDRIATTTEGTHTITDSAKLLQQLPKKFFNFLQVDGWIYRQNGRWIAYQDKINQRLMEHKFCNVQHAHGTEFDVAQPMITPKGLAKLSLSLNPAPKQPRLLMGE